MMAKAYFKCHECTNEVLVFGRNRSDANRLAEWHEAQHHLCHRCEAKHRANESEKAAASNQAEGLPALIGSDKQIAWAETIRRERLDAIEAALPYVSGTVELDRTDPDFLRKYNRISMLRDVSENPENIALFLRVLCSQTAAHWWIDTRSYSYSSMAETLREQISAAIEPAAGDDAPEKQGALEEALLKPAAEPASGQIAEITMTGNGLRVAFPEKREDFRLAMHALGFVWDAATKHWQRALGVTSGMPEDRAAETAHRLIGIGYMVRLHHDGARTKALSGQFEPENRRVVTKITGGEHDGWCRIVWPREDDFYTPAKRILGARYKSGAVYVPPGSIEEAADFAEQYGFALSPGAQQMLEKHRAALAHGAVIANPKRPDPPMRVSGDNKPSALPVPDAGMDDTLRDDQ